MEGLTRLFTAATLISSVMCVNVMRHLNHDSIEKLDVLTALSKALATNSPKPSTPKP